MIGTIRKHSKWLWWVVAGLTVISFIWWGAAPASRNGPGGTGEFGVIYGHKITPQEFADAKNEFYLFYFLHYGEWPDRANLKEKDIEAQIYIRLMIILKCDSLGIHVGDEATYTAASEMLHSTELARALGVNNPNITIEAFVKQVLQPEGLTADDFERFVRHDLAIQQLVQTMGLTGELVTPQQAAAAYEREHQEVMAQIVFFSASNYIPDIPVTPAAVGQFYTNYLAEYRLPDRVQVSYVYYNVTNYLAKAQKELTNLDDVVDSNYRRLGPDYFTDVKTPEEAKAKIRVIVIRQRAMVDAHQQANEFANLVFNQSPVQPGNLAKLAKQNGLVVRETAPFSSLYGPKEFTASEAFIKSAFALTPDDPFAGPINAADGVYVIALDKILPTEIPPLDQIQSQVTQDYQTLRATTIARRVGTNFVSTLTSQMASGHTFASACVAEGLQPEILPSFSLSTKELPELGERVDFAAVKNAAFSTPPGHASGFKQTEDGGFIMYVEKLLPVDQTSLNADLPQYLANLRRNRENEVFNEWVNLEFNHQMRSSPIYQQLATSTK